MKNNLSGRLPPSVVEILMANEGEIHVEEKTGKARGLVRAELLIAEKAKLAIAINCLNLIAKRPDLPSPDRDADWKNCMKHSSYEAQVALADINKLAEELYE